MVTPLRTELACPIRVIRSTRHHGSLTLIARSPRQRDAHELLVINKNSALLARMMLGTIPSKQRLSLGETARSVVPERLDPDYDE
jgi:hypothetical protein